MSNILRFSEPSASVRERYEHAKVDFRISFDENKNLKVVDNGNDPEITLAMIATAAGAIIMRNFKEEEDRDDAMRATIGTFVNMLDLGEDGIRE